MADTDNEQVSLDDFQQRIDNLADVLGLRQRRMEPAPGDEPYGIFSSGPHASKEYKRVPKPSYSLQLEVAKILLEAQERNYQKEAKLALCAHHGIPEDDIDDKLSQREIDEKLLPLICRDLPEEWDIDDVASVEVQRMRTDFLLDT